jgi:hypothetical protein
VNDGENGGVRRFSEAIVEILHCAGLAALQAAREVFAGLSAEIESEDDAWEKHEASMSISRNRGVLQTARTDPRGDRMDRWWPRRGGAHFLLDFFLQ